MPVLGEPDQLGQILAKRADVAGVDEPLAGLFTESAVEALFDYYRGAAENANGKSRRAKT